MKSIFVTTVTGPDTPETLQSIAQRTRSLSGEWLICKVIKLDGQLAAIMRTSIEPEHEISLKRTLESEFGEHRFSYGPAVTVRQVPRATIMLDIDCLDRPGLTRDISTMLENLDIDVEHMESTRHPLGAVSSTIYSTRVTLSAPRDTEAMRIAHEIETLAQDIKVTIL